MLNRAVRTAEKMPSFSSSPTPAKTVEDIKKYARPPQHKSIGGFTSFQNSSMPQNNNTSRAPIQSRVATGCSGMMARKRTSDEMNGFASALVKSNSFKDPGNTIDLTTDSHTTLSRPPHMTSAQAFDFDPNDFDPNDFDDDSDIDLDIEYPSTLPMSAPRAPLKSVPSNPLQVAALESHYKNPASSLQPPPSSAVPWSSSPLAHKLTPPAAKARLPAQEASNTFSTANSSGDSNPRAPKRTTNPWRQKELEERSVQEDKTERSVNPSFTPLPKGKNEPWNTTASAIKEQQKAFRMQQKKLAKDNPVPLEEIQDPSKNPQHSHLASIFLSEEQRSVLALVTQKKQSVFFTGSAGTGKSVLMRSVIADLRKTYAKEPDRVAVTASTGLAACNIGGVTLHSFGGIGLGKESVPDLVKKIKRNVKAKTRWMRTKILVIDEISMVDGELFDKLEGIARTLRNNGRPFGGIQLVITGDFFQLPPVPDFQKNRGITFAFDAKTWSTSINHTIGLTQVFRQRDPVFANMLNDMRLGIITDETVKSFKRLERPLPNLDSIAATELFPTRNEVDNANSFKMRHLKGKEYQFQADDTGTIKDIEMRKKLLQNCMAPELLTLKKGAQVMLIKNMDENLVNGSLGKVVAFMNEKTFEIYDADPTLLGDGEEGETGATFSEARKHLRSMINKDLLGDTGKMFPLVRFILADGTSRDLLCQPEDWKVELPNGEIQAQRRQLPLILAWALSIHKAQGQTLERVTVDLKKVFENGQAYVALSRATCQEGLQVKNFNKKSVMAHPKVVKFYQSLYDVNSAMKHPTVVNAPKPGPTAAEECHADFMDGNMQTKLAFDDDDDEDALAAAYGM